ncbi:MAG: hypothetical protein Q8L88_07305 [Bacteroidota bacterium]|nr:hypothetical protein [Bacteroidota bacterium]
MYKKTLYVFVLISGILFMSCKEDSTAPTLTGGSLALKSEYTTVVLAKTSGTSAVDSIKITRARFCIRDIKFKNASEDSMNFKTAPFVLDLNLTGTAQTVGIAEVKFGTYKRIEFDVHRLERPSIAGLTDTLQFVDFLKDERYSVIISGTIYINGKDSAFTYRSKVDAKQKIDLVPNLAVSEQANSVSTTLQISSANWFKFNNQLLDPADKNNEGKIDENIKASIKLKK